MNPEFEYNAWCLQPVSAGFCLLFSHPANNKEIPNFKISVAKTANNFTILTHISFDS